MWKFLFLIGWSMPELPSRQVQLTFQLLFDLTFRIVRVSQVKDPIPDGVDIQVFRDAATLRRWVWDASQRYYKNAPLEGFNGEKVKTYAEFQLAMQKIESHTECEAALARKKFFISQEKVGC